jgi:hypothetical protein
MWPLLSAVLVASAASPEVPALGRAVAADGRVDSAEWAGAREVRAGGMRIRLGTRGDVLAVAVQLEATGISSLLIGAGDRVWVLHASAALGTGEYRCAADGACTRTREFDYRCRDPSSAPAAVKCRTDFRKADGWIANADPSGTRTREFLIDLHHFGSAGTPLALAVTALVLPDRALRWPAGDDDAGSVKLQQGFLEERMRFTPRSWVAVPR